MGYPTVKAARAFKALHGSHLHEFAEGQVIGGETAAYLVETDAPVEVLDAGDDAAAVPDKPLEKMTVKELKAYAAAAGVDLGEAKKKDEILAVIGQGTPADHDDAEADADGVAGDAD